MSNSKNDKKDPMSKETVASKEEMEAAKKFTWKKEGVETIKERPKLTKETRFKIDQHVDFSAEDLEKAKTERNRKEIIKEFEDHLEFVSPEGIKNKDLYEERLKEYIRQRDVRLIQAVEIAEKDPKIIGITPGEIGELSKEYMLDVEKNPSYEKWPLLVKLIKAKEKQDIVEERFGEEIDKILAEEEKRK